MKFIKKRKHVCAYSSPPFFSEKENFSKLVSIFPNPEKNKQLSENINLTLIKYNLN